MAYLRLRDYYQLIQDANLQQIIRSDDTLRLTVEQTAQAEVIGYLTQKYDVVNEFTDLLTFNLSTTYNAHQLVELDGLAYAPATTYAANDIVSSSGVIYYSLAGANVGNTPASSPSDWSVLGVQYSLYYIPFPYDKFSLYTRYSIGDKIIYKNKVYQCLAASVLPDHQAMLQYGTYKNVGNFNSLPDDGANGLKQWGVGVNYSFSNLPIGKTYSAWNNITAYIVNDRVTYNSIIYQCLSNNTDIIPDTNILLWQPVSWVSGDDRSSLLVQKTIDVALYHLHAAIAPRNVPELRTKRYDDAIVFLKDCANGNVTLESPLLEPKRGNRIRYGGNIKNINSY